jgi:hypothetical protein
MPVTYSVRRSRFPAPSPAEIFAGPLFVDATGSLAQTDQFLTARPGTVELVPGWCGFKRDGVVFFPEKPTIYQEGVELSEPVLDMMRAPDILELIGMALRIHAEVSNPYSAADYLADPRTFFLPFLDVVEVSNRRVDLVMSETVVTAEDVAGDRRTYRFQTKGAGSSRKKNELLARIVISQRITRDIEYAEAAVAQGSLAPYLAEAQARAGVGEGAVADEVLLAQARQLRRRALQERGTTVLAETRAGVTQLLADLLPEYRRIPDVGAMLAPEHAALLQ